MQIPPGKKVYFLSDFHLGVPSAEASLVRERKVVEFLHHKNAHAPSSLLVRV